MTDLANTTFENGPILWSLSSDTNECERYSDICGPQQWCLNNIGGHSCVCLMGYEADHSDPYGRTCQGNKYKSPSEGYLTNVVYSMAASAVMLWSSQASSITFKVACYVVPQILMNASMQLFSVCHYALDLRVDVLTKLGHTSAPALLALSWLPLFVLMEVLWTSVKVSHVWIFVAHELKSMHVFKMSITLFSCNSSSGGGQCWRKRELFKCCPGWSSCNRCKYTLTSLI